MKVFLFICKATHEVATVVAHDQESAKRFLNVSFVYADDFELAGMTDTERPAVLIAINI